MTDSDEFDVEFETDTEDGIAIVEGVGITSHFAHSTNIEDTVEAYQELALRASFKAIEEQAVIYCPSTTFVAPNGEMFMNYDITK